MGSLSFYCLLPIFPMVTTISIVIMSVCCWIVLYYVVRNIPLIGWDWPSQIMSSQRERAQSVNRGPCFNKSWLWLSCPGYGGLCHPRPGHRTLQQKHQSPGTDPIETNGSAVYFCAIFRRIFICWCGQLVSNTAPEYICSNSKWWWNIISHQKTIAGNDIFITTLKKSSYHNFKRQHQVETLDTIKITRQSSLGSDCMTLNVMLSWNTTRRPLKECLKLLRDHFKTA